MMSQPRTLVIGEALVDIVDEPGHERVEHVGGSPANVAVGLARLQVPVRFASAIGSDERGTRIQEHLHRHGVALTPQSVTAHPTSTALVSFDADRNATYTFDLHWDLADIPVDDGITHVHTGSIATILPPGADRCRDALIAHRDQATLSYDPNIRPGIMGDLDEVRRQVNDLVRLFDVVKASADDLDLLHPGRPISDTVQEWLTLGPALMVITRGGSGVAYRTVTGELHTAPAPATTVVDTVGAGDSFMAGLLSGLLDLGLIGGPSARAALRAATSADVRPAIERGLATSAVTVGRAGAYAPSPEDL